jgi:uncharacterized damage-inducible protein DinB
MSGEPRWWLGVLTGAFTLDGITKWSNDLMNAEAFHYIYDYHFAENRVIWDKVLSSVTYVQFIQDSDYAHGSLRDQIIHLMDVDDVWFSQLRRVKPSEPFEPADFDDRDDLRAHWDRVEQGMRAYLAALQDEMLFARPIEEPEEDRDLLVWQVLLHVVNHGTDHRSQILRSLHDLGVETSSQDFIFYVYDHL